ncbi:MAG TPA: hypothetical protein VNT22_00750 [Baekduia sp.]|nr:hypothetical protein [Baekduia sp.]
MTEESAVNRNVHLVGSLNLPSPEAVFTTVGESLGNRILRVPDGEFGERSNWSQFGASQLLDYDAFEHGGPSPFGGFWVQLSEGAAQSPLKVSPPGYAKHAKASYATFRALRDEGKLPAGTRFLVALPTPFAWVGYLVVEDRAAVEPALEEAMLEDLRDICEAIPAADLAIQWDVSNEVGALEEIEPTHFDNILDGCAERLARMIDAVPAGVEVGLHLCYGSYEDQHFVEPKDATVMVDLTNAILDRTSRTLDFVHMPVPIERDDAEYFAPLKGLKRDRISELYLGLVHIEDGIEGSQRRLAAARTATETFGIATECGVARLDEATMRPLLELQAQSADLT